jgi:hypothetical protein
VTLGIAQCSAHVLSLPAPPLAGPQCAGLAALTASFPVVVQRSTEVVGHDRFERVVTSEGLSRWLPAPAAAGQPDHASGEQWAFATRRRELDFATAAVTAAARRQQLAGPASMAARWVDDEAGRLPPPTQRGVVAPAGAETAAPAGETMTLADGVHPVPATAVVTLHDASRAASVTTQLTGPGGWGTVQVDEDRRGRPVGMRLVLVPPDRSTVTLVRERSGSDADGELIADLASGADAVTWPVSRLVPQHPPTDDDPTWYDLFWSSAEVTRFSYVTPVETDAIRGALSTFWLGFLAADPMSLGPVEAVEVLGPDGGEGREWLRQEGCSASTPPSAPVAVPSPAVQTRLQSGPRVSLDVDGCAVSARPSDGPRSTSCTVSGNEVEVELDAAGSSLSSPLLVADSMLAARRTGQLPGAVVTDRSEGTWLPSGQRSARVSLRYEQGGRFVTVVAGVLPSGGCSVLALRSSEPVDQGWADTLLSSARLERQMA